MVINSEEEPSANPTESPKIPVLSLFAGCGAMDLGFEHAGFIPVLAIDKDRAAVDTYNHNRRTKVAIEGDLSVLTGEDIVALIEKESRDARPRGVIGGPPCQSFSISNVHKTTRDPRNQLPFHYAEILAAVNKEYLIDFFVFENVIGLKSRKHRSHFQRILQALEAAGFNVFEQTLDASWFGVPQNRKRIFIVGINRMLYPKLKFQFPVGALLEQMTVRQAIANLPEPAFFRRNLTAEAMPFHPNHWTMNPSSKKFKSNTNGTKSGRSFRQLKWDKPSLTIAYGHREVYVHPSGGRRLSIFESMRLQAIPDKYELRGNFTQQVTQVSDAVPPPLAFGVGQALVEMIYGPIYSLQQRLLDWFSHNERSFPWRNTADPYAVLVAEKLLQQTAANQKVAEIYQKILERYPTVDTLAKAKAQEISQLIAPLGLKYRGKELIKLATSIVTEFGGTIPNNLSSLLSLPGVGDYTARAVLCFAYRQRVPIVDTNVARLLFRLFGQDGPLPKNPARNRRLIYLATNLVPVEDARSYNLAVLDFCASICTAAHPKCAQCPLLDLCHYGKTRGLLEAPL